MVNVMERIFKYIKEVCLKEHTYMKNEKGGKNWEIIKPVLSEYLKKIELPEGELSFKWKSVELSYDYEYCTTLWSDFLNIEVFVEDGLILKFDIVCDGENYEEGTLKRVWIEQFFPR